MFLYIFGAFCIVCASGISVLDDDFLVLESDVDELSWPDTYTIKAVRFSLTSNLVEDFTAWRTNQSSRVDYNQGAVKMIKILPDNPDDEESNKYEIHPETTEEVLNKIVCHNLKYGESLDEQQSLDDILPSIYDDDTYEVVGNETIDEVETVKFEYIEINREKEVRKTIWAFYTDDVGWVPVRYEVKKFNAVLGSLLKHDIWNYFEFNLDVDEEVFDVKQFDCDEDAVEHTVDSEKITKELLFIDSENEKHVDHIFNHFRNKYERKYAHEYEHARRKIIFTENMRLISAVNRQNLTYKLGINQFSDSTAEELKGSFGLLPRPEGPVGTIAFPYDESKLNDIVSDLPKEYDMRVLGLVSSVKCQDSCGSCWTFAATAAVESGLAKVNGGKVLALSNQALVDCAYEGLAELQGGGCEGGTDIEAFNYIMKHGLPTEQEYGPYKNRDGFCLRDNMTRTYPITGYTEVTKYSENAMKVALVNHAPLFVGIDVSSRFLSYSSGIFYDSKWICDPDNPVHAVTVVGYGESSGELFWILKNSWGDWWGVDGYMYIAAKDNVCGVASRPSYPVF